MILYCRQRSNFATEEGIIININSAEYRQWKVQQNKKNLVIRTKKKAHLRASRAARIQKNSLNKELYESNRYLFHVPQIFSFIEDPEGTSQFFEALTTYITQEENFGRGLFIDLSQIEVLTIDALMYLLAIINNINRNFKNKYRFAGNVPSNPEIRKLIRNSGFYQFVKYHGNEPMTRDVDNIQIVSSDKVMTQLAKKISDFVCVKGNLTRKACQFLYNMMIELMANAHNHAYNEKDSLLYPRWYCFAEYSAVENTVSFTFMDTGEGIPSTVRKRFFEHLDILNLKGDGKYIVSALKGELRSETKKSYRGKGLPKILEVCQNKQIQNMRIISNRADVTVNDVELDPTELSVSLKGTLFYWQINLSEFSEVA